MCKISIHYFINLACLPISTLYEVQLCGMGMSPMLQVFVPNSYQNIGMQNQHQSQDSSTVCLVKMRCQSIREMLSYSLDDWRLWPAGGTIWKHFEIFQSGPASLSLAPQAEWKWSISHKLNLIKHSARTRQGCSVSKHSHHAYKVVHFHLLELWLHQHTIIGGKGCSPAHTVWLTGDLWAVCCRNMTAPNASPSPHNPRHPTPEL